MITTQPKPWLVQKLVNPELDKWVTVEPFLSKAQADTVADLLSWTRNVFHRVKFVVTEVANG